TVGLAQLGFADVVVVTSASQAKNVDTNGYFALVEGRTLPIKFRIEQGAVAVLPPSGGAAKIGGEGGTIALGDSSLALSIPAGALAAPTTIGVNPATSYPFTEGAPSPAYDLQPEGTVFAVP